MLVNNFIYILSGLLCRHDHHVKKRKKKIKKMPLRLNGKRNIEP